MFLSKGRQLIESIYPKKFLKNVQGKKIQHSDFFAFLNFEDVKTYLCLTAISSHISNIHLDEFLSTIILFDREGVEFGRVTARIQPSLNSVINVNDLFPAFTDEVGSFVIFHHWVFELDDSTALIFSERGYVGYRLRDGLIAWVHGNTDNCILEEIDTPLATNIFVHHAANFGWFPRTFTPQNIFLAGRQYGLFIHNGSSSVQKFLVEYFNLAATEILGSIEFVLPSGGSRFMEITRSTDFILGIKSKLVLARPLIFHRKSGGLDCWHG